jgi:hypothetical protein
MMLRLKLTAVALTATTSALAAIPAEVAIDSGIVAGTTGASAEIRAFKGIPFAARAAATRTALAWRYGPRTAMRPRARRRFSATRSRRSRKPCPRRPHSLSSIPHINNSCKAVPTNEYD